MSKILYLLQEKEGQPEEQRVVLKFKNNELESVNIYNLLKMKTLIYIIIQVEMKENLSKCGEKGLNKATCKVNIQTNVM
jgi:hypothetical protein